MDVIERELRQRPVFLVMLSPAALASQWVKDECSWAYRLARRDPARIILPILVESMEESNIWLWLQDYKRIEAPGAQPFPTEERNRRTLRALALTPQGEHTSAATPQPSESLDDLLIQGQALNFQQKHTDALPFFQRATQDDPNSFMAWFNLGVTLNHLKRYAEALAAHDRATTLDASYSNAWNNKGNALSALGRHVEALTAYDRAVALDQDSVYSWHGRGLELQALGRFEESLVAFDKLVF